MVKGTRSSNLGLARPVAKAAGEVRCRLERQSYQLRPAALVQTVSRARYIDGAHDCAVCRTDWRGDGVQAHLQLLKRPGEAGPAGALAAGGAGRAIRVAE